MGSWEPAHHPKLTPANYQETSPFDTKYNCIAWAAGKDDDWWWPTPDYYWPNNDVVATLEVFERMLTSLGYTRCPNGELEDGFEKWALYMKGHPRKDSVTHGARQLPNGRWASKMGRAEDIEHDRPQDVEGPVYGRVYSYYRRPRVPKEAAVAQADGQ